MLVAAAVLLLSEQVTVSDPRAFPPSAAEYVVEEYRVRRVACDQQLHSCPPPLPRSQWLNRERLDEILDWSCRAGFAAGRPLGRADCTFRDRRLDHAATAARCTVSFEFNPILSAWTLPPMIDERGVPSYRAPVCDARP